MPPQFLDRPSENERQRIQQFLEAVRQLLAEVVETGKDSNGKTLIRDAGVLRELRAAWADSGEYFDAARSAVAEVQDRRLREHGLYGNQLGAKFTVTARIGRAS